MQDKQRKRAMFPLRLAPSLRDKAEDLAHGDGISLNHFISLAVSEKLARMEQEAWLVHQADLASRGKNVLRMVAGQIKRISITEGP